MQEWDELDADNKPVRCRYCGMPVSMCDCASQKKTGPTIISFTVPGIPVAKGRARSRHVKTRDGREFDMHYTPKKTADAEETFVARSLEFRPAQPLTGALRLQLTFVLPCPKSAPRSLRDASAHGAYPPHIKRPDLDNLEKLVKDACNGVFWNDDSQVFDVIKKKVYGVVPRTEVRIEEAE